MTLSSTAGTSLPIGGNVANDGSLVINDTIAGGNFSGSGVTTVNSGMSLFAVNFSQAGGLVNNGSMSVTGNGTVGTVSGTGTLTVSGATATGRQRRREHAGWSGDQHRGDLDITNNHLILSDPDGSIDSTIRGYLAAGYAGGAWNGVGGIVTSSPTGTKYGIGYADGADGGVSGITSGQLEVKYTLYGDANLDGSVNSIDFGDMAANFGKSGKVWDQGDFNYDGVVNSVDFGLLAGNFGKSAGSSADVATFRRLGRTRRLRGRQRPDGRCSRACVSRIDGRCRNWNSWATITTIAKYREPAF